ncbi:MAG: P-type conjugative transfer protein TrbJ [Azospirillum sp.]|nr:P-type conjugative transfer protein TrbJ [Azospirillum sp.]
MSMRRLVFAVVAVIAACSAMPARAQFAVIDNANLAQNLLQASRALEEINNQVVQIQQFVQMLENDARNLASLPFSVLQPLVDSANQINALMGQAQGILYSIDSVEQQFQRFYPSAIAAGTPDSQLINDARIRWENSRVAFQHSIEVQSRIVADLPDDQALMAALVAQSQGATGQLQATQAGNQLLALQSRQLAATQALLAAQARADALEQARRAEAEAQAQEQFRRFLGTPSTYVPTPVHAFH